MSPGSGYIGTGIGSGLVGYGLSMHPELQKTDVMQYLPGDLTAIQGEQKNQQGYADQAYSNLTNQLGPTGAIGQQLAGEYANLGLTPQSGAFQQGLAHQYGNLLSQDYQNQSGLGMLGLQQRFGLEGQQSNADLASNLAQFLQQSTLQNTLVGGGANTVGQSAGGRGK